APSAAGHELEERLLSVEPILRLVPDAALRAVDDLGADLLAAMGGEAMEEDPALRGPSHERLVDQETGEGLPPGLRLGLLAHAGPDVGRDHIRALDGLGGIARHADAPSPEVARLLEDRRIGVVAFGAREAEVEA